MKEIRIKFEKIVELENEAKKQTLALRQEAQKDIRDAFISILEKTGNNRRQINRVFRLIPNGLAWIIRTGVNEGTIIQGIGIDKGKTDTIPVLVYRKKRDFGFMKLDDLSTEDIIDFMKVLETVDFAQDIKAPEEKKEEKVSEPADKAPEEKVEAKKEDKEEDKPEPEEDPADAKPVADAVFTGKRIIPDENIF